MTQFQSLLFGGINNANSIVIEQIAKNASKSCLIYGGEGGIYELIESLLLSNPQACVLNDCNFTIEGIGEMVIIPSIFCFLSGTPSSQERIEQEAKLKALLDANLNKLVSLVICVPSREKKVMRDNFCLFKDNNSRIATLEHFVLK